MQVGKLRDSIFPVLEGSLSKECYATSSCRTYGDERALAERVNPILVPQQSEQFLVKFTGENLDFELVVLICVDTKVFNLVQRDRLVFRRNGIGGSVCRWISAESAYVNLPC